MQLRILYESYICDQGFLSWRCPQIFKSELDGDNYIWQYMIIDCLHYIICNVFMRCKMLSLWCLPVYLAYKPSKFILCVPFNTYNTICFSIFPCIINTFVLLEKFFSNQLSWVIYIVILNWHFYSYITCSIAFCCTKYLVLPYPISCFDKC